MSMVLGTACYTNLSAPEKEELNANIIVQLKGSTENKSEERIIREQNNVLSQIRSYITTDIEVEDRFTTLVNAFSMKVNASHVDDIRNLPNVKTVDYDTAHDKRSFDDGIIIDRRNKIIVDSAKENYSASSMNILDSGNKGEGVLIAILDTGFMINGETYDEEGNVTATGVTHKAFTKLDKSVKLHDNIKSIED